MISHRCLNTKIFLWRFLRLTCVFFFNWNMAPQRKICVFKLLINHFSNTNKTKKTRSESQGKLSLTAALIQRHLCEDFIGQFVIFLTEIRLLKGKCAFSNENKTNKQKKNSCWKPKEMISHRCINTKTSLWRFHW